MANTYRIYKVAPKSGNAAPGPNAYFIPQFSQDAGTTWLSVSPTPFQSLNEAQQKLAKIVANETNFNAQVAANKLVASETIIAYP